VNSVFVARRPVFNRELELAAYEILVAGEQGDGSDLGDNVSRLVLEVAGDSALSSVLGDQPAWLSLSIASARQAAEGSLGQHNATIELPRDGCEPEQLRDLIARLQARGHSVAIETDPTAEGSSAELLHGADIAAVDAPPLDASAMASAVERLRPASAAATNLDSRERYDEAHAAGFDLFRGDFFKTPHSRGGGDLAPSRLAVLRLLGALQDPNVELPELATLLGQDVTLTYRLLRYINSAFFGMRREVTSISHALALLGLRNVKRWAAVVMLADVDHRPRELLTTALVRARFCERVGPLYRQQNVDQLFALGLFSVLDALMDTPMTKALRPLPLSEEMVGALTLRSGAQGTVLACALAAERGERCKGLQVDGDTLAELYRECLEWGTESSKDL
jgi:EAL and modified HD-GYP domain-containing signal transduction protein